MIFRYMGEADREHRELAPKMCSWVVKLCSKCGWEISRRRSAECGHGDHPAYTHGSVVTAERNDRCQSCNYPTPESE